MEHSAETTIPDYLHEAAKIFLGELHGHIEFFGTVLPSNLDGPACRAVAEQHGRPMRERFHLMKGGAGFLGLKSLKETAMRGEELCKAFTGGTIDAVPCVTEIVELAGTLPFEAEQLELLLTRSV